MMQETEYIEKLIETESRSKSNSKRIDKLEYDVGQIKELTIAVKELAIEMKSTNENVNDMNNRLKTIEQKPMKEYEETKSQVVKQVISFFVGIGLMFIAFKLGLDKFI